MISLDESKDPIVVDDPNIPREITANEARLAEITLIVFMKSFLEHFHDPARLLNFVKMLAEFGAYDPDRGAHVCLTLLSSAGAEVSGAEFFRLILRCGFGSDANGKPNYVAINKHGARCSRSMFRHVVNLESKNKKLFLPILKSPEDINTILGILFSLQAFDSLGLTRSTPGKHQYRRFYPLAGVKGMFSLGRGATNKLATKSGEERMLEQMERVEEGVELEGISLAGASDASDAEREYWRSRRRT